MDPQGDFNGATKGVPYEMWKKFQNRSLRIQIISNKHELKHFAKQMSKVKTVFEWIVFCAHGKREVLDLGEEWIRSDQLDEATWVDLSHCSTNGVIFQSCSSGAFGGVVEQIAKFPLNSRLIAPIEDITYFGVAFRHFRSGIYGKEEKKLFSFFAQILFPGEAKTLKEVTAQCPLSPIISMRLESCFSLFMSNSMKPVPFRVFEPHCNVNDVEAQERFSLGETE